MKNIKYLFLIIFFIIANPVYSKVSEKNSDILFEIEKIKSELEILRLHLGKSINFQTNITTENANSREVFFQALTMFKKTERLLFERTAKHAPQPKIPSKEINDQDVYEMVVKTLDQIKKIKNYLEIKTKVNKPKLIRNVKSSTLFKEIININRSLNLLLDYSFSPSDVYGQVELANNYTLSLINFYDPNYQSANIDFAPNKFPHQVLKKLVDSFAIIKSVYDQTGLDSITFEVNQELFKSATPSDVYDIASLVVSELNYLHRKAPRISPPKEVYYSGKKIPADVFKLASELYENLSYLNKLIKNNPSWLK